MAVSVPALRLRPLTVMDVLDESFRLYRANFPTLAALAVGLAIPSLLLSLLSGSASSLGSIYGAAITGDAPQSTVNNQNIVFALLQYPVQIALVPFQAGALFAAAVASVLGDRITVVEALRTVLRRYWALWALSLLYIVCSFTLFCLPLGIWLLVRLLLTVPVLLTERSPVGAAIGRSWQLTDRAFWRTFAIALLAILLGYALQTALAGVFVVLAGVFPGIPNELRFVVIVSVASIMTQLVEPLFALAITLVYFDRRVRREAFDLEMEAYQLARAAGAAS